MIAANSEHAVFRQVELGVARQFMMFPAIVPNTGALHAHRAPAFVP
jgi:hypothetical protein